MVKKKMTIIADVFSNLWTAKYVVKEMSKKTGFKTPFDSQYPKGYQTLLKSAAKHFYQIFLIHLRDTEPKNASLSHI